MKNIIKYFYLFLGIVLYSYSAQAQEPLAGINDDVAAYLKKTAPQESSSFPQVITRKQAEPLCDTVIEFKIVALTSTSVSVSWKHTGHYAKTKYKILCEDLLTRAEQKQTAWLSANCTSDCTQNYTFMGLKPNELYGIYIVAECDFSIANTDYSDFKLESDDNDLIFTTPKLCDFSDISFSTVPDYKKIKLSVTNTGTTAEAINVELNQSSTGAVISNIELSADNGQIPEFDNLQSCQLYQIRMRPRCVNENDGTPYYGNWENLSAKTLCCGELSWAKSPEASYDKIKVSWYRSVYSPEQKYELIIVDSKYNQTSYIYKPMSSNTTSYPIESYEFTNLLPNERYSIYVKPLCDCVKPELIDDNDCSITGVVIDVTAYTSNPCAPPLAIQVTNLQSNQLTVNSYLLGANCNNPDEDPNITFTANSDKILINWKANQSIALSPTGRRFIVKYGTPTQTKVINSGTSAELNSLSPSTAYKISIQEVFDGNFDNFTTACPPKDVTVTTLAPPTVCDQTFNVAFECIGERYAVFKINQNAASKDNTVRIYYRKVVAPDPDCDQASMMNPEVGMTEREPIMNKLFKADQYYYLTELDPCSIYEVYFETYKRNSDGQEELCNKFEMPAWYITKRSSSATTEDDDLDGFPNGCDPENNPKPKPKVISYLKDLICGDPIDAPDMSQMPAHTKGEKGDIWIINGFPMLIDDVTLNTGTTNSYSGTGAIALPFTKGTKLKVTFNGITVVKGLGGKFYVSTGTVQAFKEQTPNLAKIIADINVKAANKDADKKFCQEPGYESGSSINSNTGKKEDERGFCQDKSYCRNPPYTGYVNGTNYDKNYDPMGFDKDGNHQSGGKYSECGCDAFGNQNPTPGAPICDPKCKTPYYWIEPEPKPTVVGQSYFQSVKNNFDALVKQVLSEKLTKTTDDLATITTQCDATINVMNTQRIALGYADENLVLGPNRTWVNTGMHKLFNKTPIPFVEMNTRPDAQKALENAHKELYFLDKDRTKYTEIIVIINRMMGTDYLANLTQVLTQRLKALNATDIGEVKKDTEHPKKWIGLEIDKQIAYEYSLLNSTGAILEKNDDGIRYAKAGIESISLASAANEPMKELINAEENLEELEKVLEAQYQFEFEQGWQQVGGVDRAYILQKMAQERLKAGFMPNNPQTAIGEPFPIYTKQDGRIQAVYLDDIVITTTQASANFYAIVETGRGVQVVFKTMGFTFNASGIVGDVTLGLASDVRVPLNNAISLILKGSNVGNNDKGTYVKFNCNDGFKGIQVEGQFLICDKYVIPLVKVGNDYNEDSTGGKYVSFDVTAFYKNFNDIYLNINNLTPFAPTKFKDYKFITKGPIVVDFSDYQTPETVTFPVNYLVGTDVKLWKGLYIKDFTVQLPKSLFKNKDGAAKELTASNIIFDGGGITGRFGIKNLFGDSDPSSMNGWDFTVTDLEVQFLHNIPSGGGFGGNIHLPIFKENQWLRYSARIMPNNEYEFACSPKYADPNNPEPFEIPFWLAKAKIAETSIIKMAYINDVFSATAILDGSISINNDSEGSGKSKMAIKDITFEGLTLTTLEKPYLKSAGTWDVPKLPATVGGFTFFLDKVRLDKFKEDGEDKTKLHFIVGFELVGDPGKGFNIGATGDFDLIGKFVPQGPEEVKWKYDRLQMNALEVHARTKGFSLDGKITFFGPNSSIQSSEYGKGFYGYIAVSFEGMSIEKNPETKQKEKDVYGITALAIFGRKKNEQTQVEDKYFLVDLMVMLGKGVNLGGAVKLKAAGGGISWHMERQDPAPGQFAFSNPDITKMELGQSISGFKYLPNSSSGLSIRLMAAIAAQKEKAFNANIQFEISFNTTGGIKAVRFDGLAKFMQVPVTAAPPKIEIPGIPVAPPAATEGILAGLAMEYNVVKKTFYANLDVYVNLPVVKGCIGGCNAPYKAGTAEIFISPDDWYINIGRPTTNPDQFVSLGVGFGDSNIMIESYFNIGTKVPPLPKLPEKVLEILGPDYRPINEGLRSTGKGIAFGARFSMSVKRNGLFVDFEAEAGLGLDVMMADYGDVKCTYKKKNGDMETVNLGLNGWYATGQAYAYASAKIELFGKPLADVGGAAVLEFSGPNPFYVRGTLNAKINGKGTKPFEFDHGYQCASIQTLGSPPVNTQNSKIISTITPGNLSEGVIRYENPEVSFEVPVNREFEFKEPTGTVTKIRTNSPVLSIMNADNNSITYAFTEEWNEAKTKVILKLKAPLPATTKIMVKATIDVYKNDIKQPTDEKTAEFTTEAAWKNIPKENIKVSYPLDGMANYYKGQEETGWVTLKNDQSELISSADELEPRVRFFSASTKKMVAEMPFTYNSLTKQIGFSMPNDKLTSGLSYKMQLALINPSNASATQAESQATKDIELLNIYFRVSSFATFGAKMNAATFPVTKNDFNVLTDINVYEGFDDYETGNVEGEMPLILVEDELKSTNWYTTYALSLYNTYSYLKPATLPGDELLTLANEGSSVMPRVTKETFERNNYALNSYPKGRVEFNKYQKIKDVLNEVGKKNETDYNSCISTCDYYGDWYDENGIYNTAANCRLGCQLVPLPTFVTPPTSTKLKFRYLLYPFDKTNRMGATTEGTGTGKRRDDNSLPAGSVPANALEKSTFEVTVNH